MKSLLYIVLLLACSGSDLLAQKIPPTREQLIEKWKSIFGDVDFSNEVLFESMVYVGPQPADSLAPFGNKKMEKFVRKESSDWLGQYFKSDFKPNLDSVRPIQYYKPRGMEAGFLYYKWKVKNYNFSMYESYNAFLIRFENDSIQIDNSITNFVPVHVRIFNFRSNNVPSFRDEFIMKGPVFTNIRRSQLGKVRAWQDNIIGFIIENNISIILFKSSDMRAEANIHYMSDWLNAAIIDEKK